MSDDELDREWTPNGRPQSTMARSFSLALNDVFKIDNSLADLDKAVDDRRKTVLTQESELEALERRIRATEERLRAASTTSPPRGLTQRAEARGQGGAAAGVAAGEGRGGGSGMQAYSMGSHGATVSPRSRAPVGSDMFERPKTGSRGENSNSNPFSSPSSNSRPASKHARQDPYPHGRSSAGFGAMPGALPPTPGVSEGEGA